MKQLTILFLSVLVTNAVAQDIKNLQRVYKTDTSSLSSVTSTIFPEKCLGIWEGVMKIYSNGSLKDSVPVKFTAARTEKVSTYIWKTEYLMPAKEPIIKDYKLVVDAPAKGRYILDEGDGIALVEYVVNNKMHCSFTVNNAHLTATTELLNNKIVFEVTSAKELNETNGVKNYAVTNVQRVELFKTN